MSFTDIGMSDQLLSYSNGKEVIDYFKSLLDDLESLGFDKEEQQAPVQPVSLLVLDSSLPGDNAQVVTQAVMNMFEQLNARHARPLRKETQTQSEVLIDDSDSRLQVLRPFICHVSYQTMTPTLDQNGASDF